MLKSFTWIALCACLTFAASAIAQDKPAQEPAAAAVAGVAPAPAAAPAVPKLDTGSTAWMVMASVLVIMMTIPGLALVYGGLVRAKTCWRC